MVTYASKSNATLATVLTELTYNDVGKDRIVNIFYDTTNSLYVAVYVISNA